VIPSQVRIFVCTERQDMRRSFDALALAVRERLALDPESGALFVFASKRGNRLKVLWFDHNGYCLLLQKASSLALRVAGGDGREPSRRVDRCSRARGDPSRRRKVISRIESD
jgi:hypothetical protein